MSAGKKGIAGAELAALLQYVVSSQGPLCEKKLRKYLANYPVFDIREGPDSSYSVKTSGFPDALRLPEPGAALPHPENAQEDLRAALPIGPHVTHLPVGLEAEPLELLRG